MLPIVWSEQAEIDLLDVILFIGERDPFAAEKLGESIRQSTWPLPEHPYLFKRSLRVPDCREIVVHPNYVVIYRVEVNAIKVVRVLHTRREYP